MGAVMEAAWDCVWVHVMVCGCVQVRAAFGNSGSFPFLGREVQHIGLWGWNKNTRAVSHTRMVGDAVHGMPSIVWVHGVAGSEFTKLVFWGLDT